MGDYAMDAEIIEHAAATWHMSVTAGAATYQDGKEQFRTWLAQHDAEVAAKAKALPDVFGGCLCTGYSEDRGGGYSEHVVEYEPACPEHSEHVYDPLQGMWILRTEVPVKPERPVDPWADRIEAEGSKG